MSFRIKIFFTFLLYGVVLAFAIYFLSLRLNRENVKHNSLLGASQYAQEIKHDFSYYIESIENKLEVIESSDIYKQHFPSSLHDNTLETLFLDIAKTSKNVMQFRYINNNGIEKIRVDRKSYAFEPYIVAKDKLQDKSNRYYFKDIMHLKRGEIWYSKIDLNREHGKIELPIKPVLRVGTPLYKNNKKVGILIINIFMHAFLSKITRTKLYNILLIDKDGYTLVEQEKVNNWARYLDGEQLVAQVIKNDLNNIIKSKEYLGKDFFSIKIGLQNLEDLNLVVIPNRNDINEQIQNNNTDLLLVLLGSLLFLLPLSYFMSKVLSSYKDKVDDLNSSLNNKIKEHDILLSLFDLSDSVLFKWNNDENWSVNSVSKSVELLLEYKQEDFESNIIFYSQCVHKDDFDFVKQEVNYALHHNKYSFTHKPYRVITKSRGIKWVLEHTVIIRNEDGEVSYFVGYISDVTSMKEKEKELSNLAQQDQLTNIHNRLYLDEVLRNQYYRFKRFSENCSVIMVDIDSFKTINDTYGHVIGDKFLIEFAKLLQSSIREGDTVGRWGGEEFLIILPYTDIEQAQKLAKKLCATVDKYIFTQVGQKSASFGVSMLNENISVEQLIGLADKALYMAKSSGKNCVKTYEKAE